MDETRDIRRKRLLFRSWHRGVREADLLLGSFAERHLAELSDAQLDRYEALLANSDGVILDWITGRVVPPPEQDSDVLRLLTNFRSRPRPACPASTPSSRPISRHRPGASPSPARPKAMTPSCWASSPCAPWARCCMSAATTGAWRAQPRRSPFSSRGSR